MAGKYEKLKELGCGSFGKAWLALDKSTRTKCVLKEIKVSVLSDKEVDQALAEVSILARCRHHNVIRYADAYVDKRDGTLNIAMEYADGGDLQKAILQRQGLHFPKEVVLDWFLQICLALKFIHSEHILHRDLKPQNIFLTSGGTVKLGDFGIAKVLQGTMDHALTTIGTPYYLSPEICQKEPYNYKSDIWAAGCILYEMCCLRVPFDAPNFPSLVFKILAQNFQPIPVEFGPLIEDLINIMIQTDSDKRPSASEILNIPSIKLYIQRNLQHRHGFEERKRKVRQETVKQLEQAAITKNRPRSRSASPMVTPKATGDTGKLPEPKTPRITLDVATPGRQTPELVTPECPTPEPVPPDCTTPDCVTPTCPTPDCVTPECATPDSLQKPVVDEASDLDQSPECVTPNPTPECPIRQFKKPDFTGKENISPVPVEKPVHPALEMLRRREENFKKFNAIADKENLPGKTFTIRGQCDPKVRRFSMVTPHLNELVKKQKTERKYMSVHRPVPKRPEKVKEGPAPTFCLFREVVRSQSFSGELPKIIGTGGRSYSICGVLPIRKSDVVQPVYAASASDESCDMSGCSSLGDDEIFNCTASSVEADLRELQIDSNTYTIHKGRRMSLIHSSPESPAAAAVISHDVSSSEQLAVLYDCLVDNLSSDKLDGASLRSYLENELGPEKFRAVYNLVLTSAKTKSSYDSLKTKAKERISYLPAVMMLLQLELLFK
ncbi:cytokinesis protein sepH-like [Gigantopelta aegis]|uniref:cytokinesis protein sepH-like n=1 Tax=Gigantopelta aegis TaxID=1735272 RepID=UPI001B88E152|nr:cytokinesis protein sepH-like [Gigantopelta aegis]